MRFALSVCLLWQLGAGAAVSAEEAPRLFRAGAAAVDITPEKLPVSMTGSFQDRQATGVQDRLHARCLVLDDGQTQVAIVVCDSCLITRNVFDAAKQTASERTGLPVNRMMMSATHTHTAPTAAPLAQCRPDPEYVTLLTQRIAQSVIDAHARLEPAKIGWAMAQEPGELHNRRWFVRPEAIQPNPFGRTDDRIQTNPRPGSEALIRPAGPIDPDLAIISVVSREGRPLALLANYGLHYVGGIPTGQLSADYFGEFARRVAQRLKAGESFVGIMSNGASGDVNNINFREPQPQAAPLQRMREVADRLSDLTAATHQKIQHAESVRLAMVERTIDLAVRKPDAEEVERAKQLLQQAQDPNRLTTLELYAQETVRLAEQDPTVSVKLQALRIGDLGIVSAPCEAFAEIGLEIKRRSPLQPTFLITLANGYSGYLPTPEQHAAGGYETWRSGWSYLQVDASRKITENLVEMLETVRD